VKTATVRLLAAERIKLTSTPSMWWCGGVAVVLVVGMMGLAAAIESDLGRVSESVPYLARLGYPVVLVLAALAVTGEHRHGTLRTTFVAVPRRTMVLLAKTAVVAVGSSAVGLAAAFGSWALALLVARGSDAALDTPADWRAVAGVGLAYAVVGVIGVGVGLLVRHGAGAVTLLLGWLLAEIVASSVPMTSEYLSPWLPFTVLNRFTSAELAGPTPGQSIFVEQTLFGPWAALAYAAGVAFAVLAAAVVVTRRRDV
jgi:ABC-2 type transport system permease protein